MSRKTVFHSYQPKTILNKSKRADHWFWTRYSAYPYIGCQHGCDFCYCREKKYSPYDDIGDFAHVIRVKQNAARLLSEGLQRAPVDAVFTGDYQPAERKFGLSRQMLQVCLQLCFPVFILERSRYVLRDLPIIQEIHSRARATVAFSIISTPDSPGHAIVRSMENLASPVEKRFAAMQEFARAGVTTGTVMMPVLPGVCDGPENLRQVVRWTAEHGGRFVLVGGLTLADQQREYFFNILKARHPNLLEHYQRLYPPGSYQAVGWNWKAIALQIRELCAAAGISDRIPRPIIPGEKRALSKRIVELFANQAYAMELNGESQKQIWKYRKAAWAIEDLPQDIGLVYRQMGMKGLASIPEIGSGLAQDLEKLIYQQASLS